MSAPDLEQLALARRVLACLDLTSLGATDTADDIDRLVIQALAVTPEVGPLPAALCIYPRFVAQVADRIEGTGIRIAAVANFPSGCESPDVIQAEVDSALDAGAHEIDVVLPFADYAEGRTTAALATMRRVIDHCHDRPHPALVKVILETGVLRRPSLIAAAATDVIALGADFLKTSTGKREPGATLSAVEVLLDVISRTRDDDGRVIGLKVSGGVQTLEDAGRYLALADEYFAPFVAEPDTFRFGASKLLVDVLRVIAENTLSPAELR